MKLPKIDPDQLLYLEVGVAGFLIILVLALWVIPFLRAAYSLFT